MDSEIQENQKKVKVGIVGATGYGGVELIRLLEGHPVFQVEAVYSSSKEQKEVREEYPHLAHYNWLLEKIDPEEMAKSVDLVFTATPSGISTTLVPQLIEAGNRVVDLSGDFRLKEEGMYEKWYGKTPGPKKYIDEATYGLVEWFSEEVKESTFISNPGCYPTATLLGLIPVVKERMIQPHSIIIDAKSGLSGAGRSLSRTAHYAEINENMKIYKVNKHQHIPEIEQTLHRFDDNIGHVTFNPHLVPMTRGIMSTIYATVKDAMTREELYDVYKKAYEGSTFVRVRPLGEFPATKEVSGSNYCDIGIDYDERTNRVTIVSVIDNLVKGAAGQAIENANILMGLKAETGLGFLPMYP
ncbi:N-acetyl-gamma-glutamyl-phosphate reductase [Bacillus sp. JZ8]